MTHELQRFFYVLLFLFCFLPAVSLAIGWTETIQAKTKRDFVMVLLLLLVSGSFVWTVIGFFFPLALGRSHSGTRQAIITCNFALLTLMAVAALVWYYIAIVNAPA